MLEWLNKDPGQKPCYETPTQVSSCEYCEIFKSNSFYRTHSLVASAKFSGWTSVVEIWYIYPFSKYDWIRQDVKLLKLVDILHISITLGIFQQNGCRDLKPLSAIIEEIYPDNRKSSSLPQKNVVRRIKNLGKYYKGSGATWYTFQVLVQHFFAQLSEIWKKKWIGKVHTKICKTKMNREGTSHSRQTFEILMFLMHIIIHLMTSKYNKAYSNS